MPDGQVGLPEAGGAGAKPVAPNAAPGASAEVAGTGQGDSVNEAQKKIAELETKMEQQRQEHERNIARLSSSLDSQAALERQRAATEIEQARDRARAAELQAADDAQRLVLTNQYLQEDLVRSQQELSEMRDNVEQWNTANQWAAQAINRGIDPALLDRSGPSLLLNSVWNAMDAKIAEQAKAVGQPAPVDTAKSGQQTEEEVVAPPVVAGVQGAPVPNIATWDSQISALNKAGIGGKTDWTRDDVLTAVQYGQLDRKIVDDIVHSREQQATANQQ